MLRLALLMPLALVACVDSGDEGMFILNNTAVSDTCSLSGSPDQPFISHGTIYFGSTVPYQLTPLVQSRLAASTTGGDDASRTIQFRGANVTLTLKAMSIEDSAGNITTTQSNKELGKFSSLFAGALPPGGSVNVGVDIVPPETMRSLAQMSGADLTTGGFKAEVVAEVVILGDINGKSITSSPYVYPVTVCDDCVANNLGTCPLPMGTDVRTGNACNPFQDGIVDCCTDADGGLVCPAAVSTTSM